MKILGWKDILLYILGTYIKPMQFLKWNDTLLRLNVTYLYMWQQFLK